MKQNNLFNNTQSGFRPNDSCIDQLISITDCIFCAFDTNLSLELHGVFLNLSKAFDKVCHDGLLYKLQNNGVDGNLFCLIKSFLYQRGALNGHSLI